jgi:hypothetical protein
LDVDTYILVTLCSRKFKIANGGLNRGGDDDDDDNDDGVDIVGNECGEGEEDDGTGSDGDAKREKSDEEADDLHRRVWRAQRSRGGNAEETAVGCKGPNSTKVQSSRQLTEEEIAARVKKNLNRQGAQKGRQRRSAKSQSRKKVQQVISNAM